MKTLLLLIALAMALGCSSRHLYPSVGQNDDVLLREWTIPSKTFFEAGEKGAEFSNAVVFENTVIFGNSSAGIVSFYPGINQVRWRLNIRGGVLSQIALDKSALFFAGGDGFFYCVDAESGKVSWQFPIRNPIASRATVARGKVIFTAIDDTVYALDVASGASTWFYKRRSSPSSAVLGASAPVVDGDDVITGLSDGYVVALGLDDGRIKWERKIHQGKKFTDVDAEAVINEGVIYISSYDGALYALRRQGGEIQWRFDAGSSKRVGIDGPKLYLSSTDGYVYALQKNNAKELWKFELDGGVPTEIVQDEKRLYFGSSERYFYALDKDTGKLLYRFDAGEGSGFYSQPVLGADQRTLMTLSAGGNLMAFSIRSPLGDRKHGPRNRRQKPALPRKSHLIF